MILVFLGVLSNGGYHRYIKVDSNAKQVKEKKEEEENRKDL